MSRRLFLLLMMPVALAGCPESASGPAPPAPIEVKGVSPVRTDLAREITLPVELWAWQRVSIVAKVNGYVSNVPVDRGSVAAEGALLARISAPELEDEKRNRAALVNVAQADVASARANEDLQSVTARRYAALVADHAVSVQEVDEARARAAAATAVTAQAEAKLAAAREILASTETWLAYTTIAAPFSGVVTDRWVHPGAFVSAAERTPLFEVVDASTLRAVIDVPELEAGHVRAGKTVVRLVFAGRPARKGVVSRCSAALDARTRTLRIEVDVPNGGGELFPGMFGQAVLVLEVHEKALAVPSAAVARAGAEPFVFVIADGKARRKTVRVGLDDGKLAEVQDGLEPVDVVAAQALGLNDGAAVKVNPGSAPR